MIYIMLVNVQTVSLMWKNLEDDPLIEHSFIWISPLDVWCKIITTFEFQVYESRDKENVIDGIIISTSSGAKSCKSIVPLSPFSISPQQVVT